MTCDRARRLFGACWDDELTQAEREWLETHFASCASCRAAYDDLSRTLELAGALPRLEAPADLPERVLARVRRAAPEPDRVGEVGGRWLPIAAAAAAVVLIVAGALVLAPRAPWAPSRGESARATFRSSTPATLSTDLRLGNQGRRLTTGVRMPERRGTEPTTAAVIPDSLFDHGEDVEFILDPVTLHRGRASMTRPSVRAPGAQGQQALITF